MDRRIDVGECPFVRRDLAVRMHVPLAREQQQLLLREVRVDHRERDRVEGHVPRREPRILPLVGHRQDVLGRHVPPGVIAPALARFRRRRLGRVTLEPLFHEVAIVLLVPQHSGERLPLHAAHVGRQLERRDPLVERIGLFDALREYGIERRPEGLCHVARVAQAKLHHNRFTRTDWIGVVRRGLGAFLFRIHRTTASGDDAVVDAVLDVR